MKLCGIMLNRVELCGCVKWEGKDKNGEREEGRMGKKEGKKENEKEGQGRNEDGRGGRMRMEGGKEIKFSVTEHPEYGTLLRVKVVCKKWQCMIL